MNNTLRISILLLLSAVLLSCQTNTHTRDLSKQANNYRRVAFEHELFYTTDDSLETKIPTWASKWPAFFELYNNKVINIGSTANKDYIEHLKVFRNYITENGIDKRVFDLFDNNQTIDNQLSEAFKYYHYHFPNKPTIAVYTYISGFSQSVAIADGFVGIGLDKYLGSNSDYYKRMNIEKYKRKKMYPQKLAADLMEAIAISEFVYNDSIDNMLARMIHQGKILYFLDATLVDMPDSIKIGYSAKNIEWVEHNESEIWDYMIAKKLLFSTDKMQIRKFTDDGPFTAVFGQKSPPRVAVWLAWQIVRQYMQQHKSLGLPELMANTDYQAILRYSKYRP